MRRTTRTRRDVLGAGAVGAVGLLAGCVSGSSPGADGDGGAGRTVSMEPVGEITVDGVPENVATYFPDSYSGELFDREELATIITE